MSANLVFTRFNAAETKEYIHKIATVNITTANNAEIESKEIYTDCSVELRSENPKWNYSGTGRIFGKVITLPGYGTRKNHFL